MVSGLEQLKTYCGSDENQKLSLFFVAYVGISMKKFAFGISRLSYFSASNYGIFLLVIRTNLVIRNGPSTYVIEKNELRKNKSGHVCGSHRAQLLIVTPPRLRGQNLAEKLFV